jgi:hypothetical protein
MRTVALMRRAAWVAHAPGRAGHYWRGGGGRKVSTVLDMLLWRRRHTRTRRSWWLDGTAGKSWITLVDRFGGGGGVGAHRAARHGDFIARGTLFLDAESGFPLPPPFAAYVVAFYQLLRRNMLPSLSKGRGRSCCYLPTDGTSQIALSPHKAWV